MNNAEKIQNAQFPNFSWRETVNTQTWIKLINIKGDFVIACMNVLEFFTIFVCIRKVTIGS